MRAVSAQPSFAAHPLALLAASLAAGIFAARELQPALPVWLSCGACGTALALLAWRRGRLRLALLLVAAAFICAGGALAVLDEREAVGAERVRRFYESGLIASGEPVEVTGVMTTAPESAPEGFYLSLRVESLRFKEREYRASGTVRLSAPVRSRVVLDDYERLALRYGARLRLMTALERADSFRNPGVSSLTEYLERRSIDALGVIKSPLLVERLEDEPVLLPLAWLYEWRQRLLGEIGSRFDAETAGVLDAALLGNRYHLSRAASERFREGGTFHVLVISGLHISFIGAFILLVVRRLTGRRAVQFACSTLCLWAYALMVGAEASVLRAALMFTMAALAPLLQREAASLNALAGAAILLLVLQPSELFDPSFQLTFLSVLVIVTIAWPLLRRLQQVGEWRPSGAAPHPPVCPSWFRALGEILFWRESEFRREMAESIYHYRLFKHPLAARLERLRLQSLLRYMCGALLVSASVQAGLLPLLVLYFHRLSLASLLLNIVVGALMALLALAAIAALLLSQLSETLAAPLVRLTESLNWLMVHSVDPFARAHLASIRLPEYSGRMACIYALYYLLCLLLAFMLARWQPLKPESDGEGKSSLSTRRIAQLSGLASAALLVLIIAHPLSAGREDGRLRVDFLDVGQGDAALVTMPDGTTLLIDAGGRPSFNRQQSDGKNEDSPDEESASFERDARSIGEWVVSEYLWSRGLDSIDYILATHADADHMDGLNDIARNFRVRAAFVARAPARDPEYARFASTMQREGVPVLLIGRGDLLRFGLATAEVLWPDATPDQRAASDNNDSIVLSLRYGTRKFLLTGDLEKEGEAALLQSSDDLASDVVKVAHHGSKTSSTEAFVAASRPSLAVVSVGLTSPFGHPDANVLERWRAHGARVLTTGHSGTISISTDGHDLKLSTFVKQ